MKKELKVCDRCHSYGTEKISTSTCPFCGVDLCGAHSRICLNVACELIIGEKKKRITADSPILRACLDCYGIYTSPSGKSHISKIGDEAEKKIIVILNDFVDKFIKFGEDDQGDDEDGEEGHEGRLYGEFDEIGDDFDES